MSWFAFDADFYSTAYPDLRHFSAEEAKKHYVDHGINEGRQASPFGTRQTFLEQISSAAKVLEVGPFVSPLIKGAHVRYADIFTREQLLNRAVEEGLDVSNLPDEIHYVGEIEQIETTFDVVVGSHSIEHQPDLVRHLSQIGRILAEGGCYFLMIPDKRYCFDHFIPESTIADVLLAHAEGRRLHTLGSVIEHFALTTHSDAARHWAGDHGSFPTEDEVTRIGAAIDLYNSNSTYIDVHAWYFTPITFFNIVSNLYQRGTITLRPKIIFPTLWGTSEFFAILEKSHSAA